MSKTRCIKMNNTISEKTYQYNSRLNKHQTKTMQAVTKPKIPEQKPLRPHFFLKTN